jgi:hypothetical protein
MKFASIVALLVGVLLVQVSEGRVAEQFEGATAPYVIFWPQAPESRHPPTAVGLLYTPSVLAVMARESPDSVSPRIDNAIREQTPLVVMWTIPPMATANREPWPRPFSSVIVEGGADSFGSPSGGKAVRIEPLWIEQHADDLRRLDHRTRFSDVGVMAAYPRSAFVPGRLVTIFVRVPSEPGTQRGAQRFGLIVWNGATD